MNTMILRRIPLPNAVFLSGFFLPPDFLLVKPADQASATASVETAERREEEYPADHNCCHSGSRRNESKGTEQKLLCNKLLFPSFHAECTSYTLYPHPAALQPAVLENSNWISNREAN